jgi:hypothetical protein
MRDLDLYFDTPASLSGSFRRAHRSTWRDGLLYWHLINALRANHRSGRADNSYELFSIIVFDQWFSEQVMQSEPAESSLHASITVGIHLQ